MSENAKISVENMDLHYGDFHALKNINMNIPQKKITAFIGPSGCGKSTLLKSLNRMNDLVESCVITGKVQLDGEISMEVWTSICFGSVWEWCFRNRIPSP